MRFTDILGLSLGALYRQKLRTLLTTLGVVCGSFVLFTSLSLRQGVQETILRELSRFGDLRQVEVSAGYGGRVQPAAKQFPKVEGTMSQERRERLQAELERRHRWDEGPVAPTVPLTRERLRQLERIEHVRSVTLWRTQVVTAVLVGKTAERAKLAAAPPADTHYRQRLIAGNYFAGADSRQVLVTEWLLYELGITGEAEAAGMVGKTIRLGVRSIVLPEWLNFWRSLDVAEDYTICGILRVAHEDEAKGRWGYVRLEADVVLPPRSAEDFLARLPFTREFGFESALVEVDDAAHVKAVTTQVKDMGLRPDAMLERVEVDQFIYNMVFSGMSLVAMVALAVAALGIANTMLMGVLERVREIGVMKAVGARDGAIQMIFLVEGALIGLVGGVVGVLLARVLAGPGDAWMRSILERNTSIKLEESVFVFPVWLVLGAPAFACLMTTLAAVFPARRAARVDPVAALRHE